MDEEITLRLSQAQFGVVLAHLQGGRYCDVAETIATLIAQASPQLIEHAKVAEAEASHAEALARGTHLEVH